MFQDIHRIVLYYNGIDQVVDEILSRFGELSRVYLIGSLAKGLDSRINDIVLVRNVNKEYVIFLIEKIEHELMREIRYVIYSESEFEHYKNEVLERTIF